MKKDRITISANEVNKFTYCPHQWYYERVYGAKELRARYRERNERLGLDDAASANFARGQEFHSTFSARRGWAWLVWLLLLTGIALAAYLAWIWLQGGL